jgi:phage terminase large subunit
MPPRAADAANVLQRAQRDPAWFAREVLGVHWWSKQVEIAEAVRDHRRTAVRSGHGVGKTYVAAGVALWFLYSFPDSRVISTAPTWQGVEKLLWHEINRLHGGARFPLGGQCLNVEIKLPDGRFAVGLSSDPARAEAFQGHHAPNILVIFDEASGIDRRIFEAAEGYMTTRGARMLLIGNPTQPAGTFFDAFHERSDEYNTLHVSALDSPAFTGEFVSDEVRARLTGPEWVADKRSSWGEDSPLFHVRVLGNFSTTADDTVVPLAAIEAAQQRHLDADPTQQRVTLACDIARFGSDETVLVERVGDRVRIIDTWVGKPTTYTVGRISAQARRYPPPHLAIVIDDVGVGGGVTDQLREQGFEVVAFNGGERAWRRDDYPNRRSELWFQAREQLADLDLDTDDRLAADLTAPRYTFDSAGRRVVEIKEQTKKRLGRSPDRGDAVLLTLGRPIGGWGESEADIHEAARRAGPSPMRGVLSTNY